MLSINARRCFSSATFCLWILMTRQCLRGRVPPPPPALTLVKLTVIRAWPPVWAHLYESTQSPRTVSDALDMSAGCRGGLFAGNCCSCCWCFFFFFFLARLLCFLAWRDWARACCVTSAQLWREGWKKKKKMSQKCNISYNTVKTQTNSYYYIQTMAPPFKKVFNDSWHYEWPDWGSEAHLPPVLGLYGWAAYHHCR